MAISDKHVDNALRYEGIDGRVRVIRGDTAGATPQPDSGTAVADVATADPVDVPAGGTGAAAGGWDTAGNRDTAISRINLAWDTVIEIKAQLNSLLAELRARGVISG